MKPIPIKSIPIAQTLEDLSDQDGKLSIADFMEAALYHPKDGYYTKAKNRVGRSSVTDFFTSSSFAKLFGQILIEATTSLLKSRQQSPANFTWVEIGAEPDSSLLTQQEHPFKETRSVRIGDPIDLEGNLIVFSNELFDAQPCHSVTFDDGQWKERFVRISEEGLSFTLGNMTSAELEPYQAQLPKIAPEGYTIDIPTRSEALVQNILYQDWKGTFIAFDYGKTWRALINDTPQGTLRAYKNHRQVTELLDDVGNQDLTCHICWDFISDALKKNHFANISLESQESFVIKRAPQVVENAFDPANDAFSTIRSQLKQLIHPTLMGQKFQAITAFRP